MADINVVRQQVASSNAHSTIGVEAFERARGARKGDAATALQKSSDLTDIQEEIGNSVGKLADKRTLGQAVLRQGAGVNKEALKRIADYYEKLPDAPAENKLHDLVKSLESFEDLLEGRNSGRRLSAADILQALSTSDPSSRRQYMLLQGARLHFENKPGSDGLVSLLDAAEKSYNESGVAYDVRADYAMLAHAKKAGPSLGIQPEELRDKYREMLLSGMNLGQLFYALSDFYKRLNFHAVIDLFLKAAGDDLAATSSRTDRSFLGNLLKELGILKTLRSASEASAELLRKTRRQFPRFGKGKDADGVTNLMGELLTFCAKQSPSLDDARKVLKGFQDDQETPQMNVVFCNGVLDLHRGMADPIFPSPQARLQQIGALMDLCSNLVEIEEQAYATEQS